MANPKERRGLKRTTTLEYRNRKKGASAEVRGKESLQISKREMEDVRGIMENGTEATRETVIEERG